MAEQAIEPLKQMLESIMGRLASIEAKVGIETNSVHDAASNGAKPKPAGEFNQDRTPKNIIYNARMHEV